MGLSVGVYKTEWLPRPERGPAYDFLSELAASTLMASSDGNAYGSFSKEDAEELADGRYEDEADARAEVQTWLDSLPWDEDGVVSLTINW